MVVRARKQTCLVLLLVATVWTAAASDIGSVWLERVLVSPPAVDRGGAVTVFFDIGYLGSFETVVVQMACRRSDLESDCLLERKTVSMTDPSPQHGSFSLDTSGLSPGEYEITVRLDPDRTLLETDPARDRSKATLSVRTPLPDLVPIQLSVRPHSPIEAGSTVVFSTRVTNTGAASASAFRVLCEMAPPEGEWTVVGSTEIPGLERDRQVDVSFPYTATQEGAYRLRVRVELKDPSDPERGFRERDEENNTLVTSFSVAPNLRRLPDLRPTSLTLSPSSPLEWQENATATVVIVNSGGAATEQGVQVAFQYRRVGAGEADWKELKDPQRLKDNAVSACSPSNWQWAVRPDAAEAESLSIETGRNTRILSVMIDFAEHQKPRICDGQQIPPRILPGEYELKVIVDPLGITPEQDKQNNELVIGFSILGSDLQVESLELSRSSVERGTDVIVRAAIRNAGAKTAEAFTVGFFVGARRLDTYFYSGTGLSENDTVTVQGVLRTHDLAEGNHLVRVVVDPDGQVYEGDTSSNTISGPLEILGLPTRRAELFVDRIEFSPTTPISPERPFSVRAAVNNAGDLAAGPFDVAVQILRSDGESVGPLDRIEMMDTVQRLEPSQTLWLEWPVMGLALGRYGITVEVDPATDERQNGQVMELDETNNRLSSGFSVRDVGDSIVTPVSQANLVCQELMASPATLTMGAPVALTAVVANTGSHPTGPFNVQLGWSYATGQVQVIETLRLGTLTPGETADLSRTLDTSGFPHGAHQVVLRLDVDDEVDESSKADNVCSTPVQIGAAAIDSRVDLVPVSVRFDSPGSVLGSEPTVEQQQRLYVYVTVRNHGNIPSGPFQIAFISDHGETRESWTSVGPLDQVEVSHPLPTSLPGTFSLEIQVDPDGLIPEGDRSNNMILSGYSVLESVVNVERIVPPSGAPARWIAADGLGTTVYAVWTDGWIRSLDMTDVVQDSARVVGTVQAVSWDMGATPTVYLGTHEGSFYRVRLDQGSVSEALTLEEGIRALAIGQGGRVYAAVDGGFHELSPVGTGYRASSRIDVTGDVLGILYDPDRSTLYVLSTTGVHAFGTDLSSLCFLDASEMVGTPSTFVLASTGLYVGMSAGTGSVVYALGHCMPMTEGMGHILLGWRYPRVGSLPGLISHLVVDPREIDPIYVATSSGSIHSLSLDGALQWSFDTGSAIRSRPVIDSRTGRVFFGSDAGDPYVLSLEGTEAFEFDRQDHEHAPKSIASTLAIVESRQRTELGTRLVRNYYYGTEDGAIYKIAAQQ
jgi:subtilase family serine protease/outer membrane protein assembly factor BamB